MNQSLIIVNLSFRGETVKEFKELADNQLNICFD